MNITGEPAKILAVYVIMGVIYTVMAFMFIYYYWQISISWSYDNKHSHAEKFTENEIALHSILVYNLPIEMP